jgi:hypothetical protein
VSFFPSFFFWFRLLNGMAERLSSKQTSSFSNHHGPLFGLHSVKRHRHERASVLPKHDFCCSCSLQGERGTYLPSRPNEHPERDADADDPWTMDRASCSSHTVLFFFRVSRPTETTVLPHCSLLTYRYRYKLQYTCSCVSMSKSNLCTRYVLLANQPANRFFVFQRFCSLVPTMTATR